MAEHAMGYRFVHDWFQLPDGFPLGNCHGLAVDGRGHVFLLQQNGNPSYPAVLEFSSEGRYLGGWGNSFARGGHGLLLTRSREEERSPDLRPYDDPLPLVETRRKLNVYR